MGRQTEVLVTVRRGMVEEVYSNNPNVKVHVADFDSVDGGRDIDGAVDRLKEDMEEIEPIEVQELQFVNHYRHDDCPVQPGVEWEDTWSCMCNDHCPACDAEIEPYQSEEV